MGSIAATLPCFRRQRNKSYHSYRLKPEIGAFHFSLHSAFTIFVRGNCAVNTGIR